jgi:hypothetical protein
MPDSHNGGPALDFLLKEVSYSTCDNKFFGELEKEMLIPNNLNIHGKIQGATSLRNYQLLIDLPQETVIGYIKKPVSSNIQGDRRVLTYKLEDLINFEDYWWFQLEGETEFHLALNLLPPFPRLNPVDLQINCQPDIAVGLNASVTTKVRLEAEEHIDKVFLRFNAPAMPSPGVSMAINRFSGYEITEPRMTITSPKKEFPFPQLSLNPGQSLDYTLETKITADPSSMLFLRCQQDILSTRLLMLSKSTPADLPCGVTIVDEAGQEIPILRTTRSTILQANAQIMYSPYSMRPEEIARPRQPAIQAPAQ